MSDLVIKFWGVRGSVPVPGRSTEKYGGNTTSAEIRCGDTLIIIDAGTGIIRLGNSLLSEFQDRPIAASLLFTHWHWDHIQGFPFFQPAWQARNAFTVYGENRPDSTVKEILQGQMQGEYFPVPLSAMQARFEFHSVPPEFAVGPVRVRTFPLAHPGGSVGYRFETERSVLVFASDCELDKMALNPEEIAANPAARRRYPPEMLKFFSGAHMIVIDCQYTDAQYEKCRGWGHNSVSMVVDLCRQVQPAAVALSHHDPWSADDDVTNIARAVATQLRDLERAEGDSVYAERGPRVLVFAAREGLKMRVETPRLRPVLAPFRKG